MTKEPLSAQYAVRALEIAARTLLDHRAEAGKVMSVAQVVSREHAGFLTS
jgi:hypothetical protein